MIDERKWRFPSGGFGEIKGINDAGVETFNSNTLRSLVRESIQNSLDAATGDTVYVDFSEYEMSPQDIPDYPGLLKALDSCLHNGGDSSETASAFFRNALETARSKTIRVMRISDYHTTGLRGADKPGTGTDWSRLVKESGSSNKGGSSGGSFGIGKYSTFACSDLRTVFFSTLDCTGYESHIGVSRLISYLSGDDGQYTTGVGYYSGSEKNEAVPGQVDLRKFTKRDPGEYGTDIIILGFKCEGDVTSEIIKYALTDFLVSIWKKKLGVSVNGENIGSDNLGAYVGRLNEFDKDPRVKETIEHYDLLTSSDPSVKIIEFDPADMRRKHRGINWEKGDCRLFLKQGGEDLNREVTITRKAGMRIFNQDHISGSIRFTGILMIEGEGMNADFKQMEAPSHDEWSPERAQNSKLAAKMIVALKNWVKDKVEESYSTHVGDEVEAFGTALYLPRREPTEAGEEAKQEESLNLQLSEVTQVNRTPKRGEKPVTVETGVTFDPEGDAIVKGKGKARGKTPRRGTAPGDEPGFVRVSIRERLVCTNQKTGEYKLKFVVPHDASKVRIHLSIHGEQGDDVVEIKSATAVVGEKRGASFEGDRILIDNVEAGSNAEVTFSTGFPYYCMMGADYYEAS